MSETIYIYTSDKYGNPGPFLCTLPQLRADLEELAELEDWEPSRLRERTWAIDQPPVIMDQDNDIIAEVATLESLERYGVPEDGGGLFWEVVTLELAGTMTRFLTKQATYGELRRVMELYRRVIEE